MVKIIVDRKETTNGIVGKAQSFKYDAMQKVVDHNTTHLHTLACDKHPDYENKILCDTENGFKYYMEDSCCKPFAMTLQEIVDRQNDI